MNKSSIPLGILFSTTGPYATVSEAMLCGAKLAIDEVNDSAEFDFAFTPSVENPAGESRQYARLAQEMLRRDGAKHIVGCYTSSSRKEVVPVVEKYDALLWYPSHYEGFESSPNVVYTGASPNQHIVPLAEYMIQNYGANVYLLGSDYIWPWESNRVMSAMVAQSGGQVLAERYMAVGSLEVGSFIQEIRDLRPDFIFNTLIGESSYDFLRKLYRAELVGRDASNRIPVSSCTLSEPELLTIGAPAAAGHITSSVYFQSLPAPQNLAFVANYRHKFGPKSVTCADSEATYNTVQLLARAIRKAGTEDPVQVLAAAKQLEFVAPQGPIWVDSDNNHCFLTPRIGISTADANFRVLASADGPCKPDPYLVSLSLSTPLHETTSDSGAGVR